VHAGAARVDEGRDHIDIARAAFHALLVLDPTQQRDLVTQLGGRSKSDHGRLFHLGVELVAQLLAAPFRNITEWRTSSAYSSAPPGRHKALAALDLVLQAGRVRLA
jgi:hypothetical protein